MTSSTQQLNQPDEANAPSWESYLRQLGTQFQIKITQPDALLRLSSLATSNQLTVGVHKDFVVVSYGETSEEGISPNAEVVFDIGKDGSLTANEIVFTSDVWSDFQNVLAKSNLPASDEQNFDGERFALYLLGKVT